MRWLYCLGLYRLTRALGPEAATLVKCLFVLATFATAAAIASPRRRLVSTCAVVAVAALACSQRFVVRPETLSYGFLVLFVAIVQRARAGPTRWLFVLPAVGLVWANVHGLFVLGPAVAGAWLASEVVSRDAGRRRRTAAWVLAATVALTFANPYGYRVWVLAMQQFTVLGGTSQKDFFVELASPFAFGQRFTAVVFYEILIGLAVVSAILAWRRQELFWLLVVGAQLGLSAVAIRNLPLFGVVAVPFVVRNLARAPVLQRDIVRRRLALARAVIGAGVVALSGYQLRQIVTDRFAVQQGDTNQFGLGIAAHRFPERAAVFLAAAGSPSPIFQPPGAGAYLLARGHRVFIDPRGEVYQDRIVGEYRSVVEDTTGAALDACIERYDLRVFFLDADMFELVRRLEARGRWRLVYADAQAQVLFRDDTAPEVPALDPARDETWFAMQRSALPPPPAYAGAGWFGRVASPEPYRRLARLAFERGAHAAACAFYADAYAAYPPGFTDHAVRGFCAARAGDAAGAAQAYARAAALEPGNADLAYRAGLQSLLARAPEALRFAERAVQLAPREPRHLALRGLVALHGGRGAEAQAWFERALVLAPRDASLHRNLGKSLALQSRDGEALERFEAALRLDPADTEASVELVRLLARAGRTPEAAARLREALERDPGNARLRQLAGTLQEGSP